MLEAKVVVCEDDESIHDVISLLLSNNGHRVVGWARTRAEALELVDQSQSGQLETNVWLLDGNLDRSHTGQRYESGDDARATYDAIKRAKLPDYIIGISAGSLRLDYGLSIPAELDITKSGVPRIASVLDSL